MIIVTGSILARAEHLDELIACSLEHVRRSRTEAGCVSHAVHRDLEIPLRLVFIEEWTSRDSLVAHFAEPASRTFVRLVRALAAAPPTIRVYEATAVPL